MWTDLRSNLRHQIEEKVEIYFTLREFLDPGHYSVRYFYLTLYR